jgi:glycosyltransferase involved in cell wall biosynthesis
VADAGISVVILSYERPRALAELLRALLSQDLGGLALEVLLCNNAPAVSIESKPGSEIGDLLGRFSDAKVFNSSYNWLCRVRYTLATLARHDTIFFIDDDLSPADPSVVRDLYDALARLGPLDIVSCWTALWTEWSEDSLTKVRMGFTRPAPTEITECDYVGPGISMFRRPLLLHPAILDQPPERWRSDSSWFPWVTAMELGSRKYYVPTHGRFRIHPESRHAALNDTPGFRAELYAAYKEMWKRGYQPVLGRTRNAPGPDSPERRAARELRSETDRW